MRRLPFAFAALAGLLGLVALSFCPPVRGEPDKDAGHLTVHEWGTFLSVQGSDGATMGGMVESEEQLPRFVRERSLGGYSRASLYQKMETPVTYFYTDRPTEVSVQVTMPRGLLTHWFPTAHAFGPPTQNTLDTSAGSFIDWGQLIVTPDPNKQPDLLGGSHGTRGWPELYGVAENDTWRFARDTDSALVKFKRGSQDRYEKFLFYRGLGSFELPLEVRSSGSDGDLKLTLRNRAGETLRGVFGIWVKNGTIRYGAMDDLKGEAVRDVDVGSTLTNHYHLKDGVAKVKEDVAASLVKAGLYPKEAQAMVNTWERSYFQNDGLRVLYILPRNDVDRQIPIQITPKPEELVRVMVGRIEVLTPDSEKRIEAALAKMSAEDVTAYNAAMAELDRLGRLKEPVLRRIAVLTRSPEVKERAETLIAKNASK